MTRNVTSARTGNSQSSPDAPLLRLRGLSKAYGEVQANRGIDLDVMPRSIHAILGENGAGKSTLMKLISGIEAPDGGTMEWHGQPVRPASPAAARRLGVGMVFQHFSLFETLTVLQNIALVVPGRPAELARRIVKLGKAYGLEVEPKAQVLSLPLGVRQRIEILRCLMLEPTLLVLDEPTSVLPPLLVAQLFDTLRQLRDQGMSILFISHKLDEIRTLCDDATVLRDGTVTGRVDPRTVDSPTLTRMMIGRESAPALPAEIGTPGTTMLQMQALDWHDADPFAKPLKNIDLHVRTGEIVGIAGISGNGQSELAALVSGEARLFTVHRESIQLNGQPIGDLGPAARRRLGMAFVPEERLGRGSVAELSLVDNALLTAHGRGLVRHGLIDRRRAATYASACIHDFDVRTVGPHAEAGALSGGNLQKFVVGREIMLEPRFLLVQQPTWGVDVGAAAAIRQRLVEMRNAGCALLIISEEIEEIFAIADRIHVMRAGELSPSFITGDTSVDAVGAWMMNVEAMPEDVRA